MEMSWGDERSAGRQGGDAHYKERREHAGRGERRGQWALESKKSSGEDVSLRRTNRIFYLGDHAASNGGPDRRHGCIRAPRGLAFLASTEGIHVVVYERERRRRVCLPAHASHKNVLSFVSLKILLCLFIGPALSLFLSLSFSLLVVTVQHRELY